MDNNIDINLPSADLSEPFFAHFTSVITTGKSKDEVIARALELGHDEFFVFYLRNVGGSVHYEYKYLHPPLTN